VIVEELFVKVIDEVKGAVDAHTHYHTDDGTSDFMSTAAAALTMPSIKISRREIEVWNSRTLPLPKTNNLLREWHRGVQIFPWLSLLARRVLAIPDTSASLERRFPTSGNTMTNLSCHHLELFVYLRETWPQVSTWAADNKVLDMD